MNHVRQNFIDILAELAEMDLLGDILSQILGYDVSVKKYDKNLSSLIRESDYALS